MAKIRITRNREGKIEGASEADRKAYVKFRARVMALEAGEILSIEAKAPRNPELHGWHFIILDAVFEAQEQFEDERVFRKWVEVGAGHCDFVPGPKGRMVALPRSIGWDEMEDLDFQEHHEKAVNFLRSPDCTRFLWGHLSDLEQSNMIEGILTECEVRRQEIRQQRGKGMQR
jgi:hypothetical protein